MRLIGSKTPRTVLARQDSFRVLGIRSCARYSTADVSTRLERSAKRTDNDPRHFCLHSLRSEGATQMYRFGTDALTIQFHGRWVSDAFKAYTRLFKEFVTALASTMIAGTWGDSTLHYWCQ
ncbi:hypothetical protein PHMEG_00015240 [Phytophthora megakarya]|uniref:Tyr recombinase domain-containing protein n=1 Tax=Phytophthora megakarya TaxID=4795 RepID=A0A225W289_9STRA|nr:hypothetical protein PHMEG_00015240 [Phytophthora megakarya]